MGGKNHRCASYTSLSALYLSFLKKMSTEMKRTLFLLLSIYVNLNLGVETTTTTELTAIDKRKTCADGRACYFKVGGSLLDCNVSEDKNYRQLPFRGDGFSHVTSFNYSEIKNSENEYFLNVSGEFNLTEDFTPTHILVSYNSGNLPFLGKFYLLKLPLENSFLGKQKSYYYKRTPVNRNKGWEAISDNDFFRLSHEQLNFQIDCLSIMKPTENVHGSVTIILLAATEENVKKTTIVSEDNLLNICWIELKYNVEEHLLNVKLKNVSSINSYNVSLFWNDNEQQLRYHCDGRLLWHKSSNKTEFNIPQGNLFGDFNEERKADFKSFITSERDLVSLMALEKIYCVKFQSGSYVEERIFKLKDVIPDVRNTNSYYKKMRSRLTAINANLEIEFQLESHDCHLLHICLYKRLTKVCTNDRSEDLRKNKTCVLQKLQDGNELELKFTHLSPGNYCVKIYPVHCNCKPRGFCNFGAYTPTVILTDERKIKNEIKIEEMPHFYDISTVLLIVISVAFGLITMSVLLYLNFFRRCRTVNEFMPITDIERTETSCESPRIRIFLLYSYERSKLDDIVLKFIQVLEECFFCEVIHIMNENELDRAIIHTPSGWVLSSLHQADKVIIIESVKASEMQKRWINSQTIAYSCVEERIFLSGLITLQNRQIYRNDYEQLIVVRFHFTPSSIALQDVVENCRFILPTSLPDLFFKIHRKKFFNNKGQSINTFNAEKLVAEWEKESEVYNEFVKECNGEVYSEFGATSC